MTCHSNLLTYSVSTTIALVFLVDKLESYGVGCAQLRLKGKTNMAELKFCKDCKWCVPSAAAFYDAPQCSQPTVAAVDLVSGVSTMPYCSSMRQGSNSSAVYPCGLEGVLFEPKSIADDLKGRMSNE